MKHRIKIAFSLSLICFFNALANTDSLYLQADKLYSEGNFEAAAKAYLDVCSKLEKKQSCLFNEVKSLIESKNIDLVRSAEPKLLLLISQTEPNDSLFAYLSLTDAKLQIMLNQPVRAVRSWNAAQASANPSYFSELFVVCNDIVFSFPENGGLTAEKCNKIKPSDTTFISLPRNKITVLTAPQNTQTALNTQNTQNVQAKSPEWYIQLGAFGAKENAEKLVNSFKSKNVILYIIELPERKLFAVRTGNFDNMPDAKNYAEQKIAPSHKDYQVLSNK